MTTEKKLDAAPGQHEDQGLDRGIGPVAADAGGPGRAEYSVSGRFYRVPPWPNIDFSCPSCATSTFRVPTLATSYSRAAG